MAEASLEEEVARLVAEASEGARNLLRRVTDREKRDRFEPKASTPDEYAGWAWLLVHGSGSSSKSRGR